LVCVGIVFTIPHVNSFIVGFPLIALIPIILICLSVITWKWLGGKEAKPETLDKRASAEDPKGG
jgi:hypothetical protein